MPWTIERKHPHVAVVTMNTNKVNAQNPAFFADLHGAFDRLESEFADCAVVLTGSGAVFTAGLDFDHHFPMFARRSIKEIDAWFDEYRATNLRLFTYPRPTVAAINGHAYAGDAIGPRSAFELTLFGQIYDLAASKRLGVVQQTVAPDKLIEAAVAWAALVPPDCYTAYAFSKRALQATAMTAIAAAARLDQDLLSRGMSDLGSIRAHTRRYKELKGKDVTWPLPT
jgi:enoyl-CoA hydratase